MLIQAHGVNSFSKLKSRTFQKRSGFTLVEILVVIAILSILISISYSNITSSLPKRRLEGATNAVVQFMQNARFGAIKTNFPMIVTINGNVLSSRLDTARDGGATVTGTYRSEDISANYKNCYIAAVYHCAGAGAAITEFSINPDGQVKWVGAVGTSGSMPVIVSVANTDVSNAVKYQSVTERSGVTRYAKDYAGVTGGCTPR